MRPHIGVGQLVLGIAFQLSQPFLMQAHFSSHSSRLGITPMKFWQHWIVIPGILSPLIFKFLSQILCIVSYKIFSHITSSLIICVSWLSARLRDAGDPCRVAGGMHVMIATAPVQPRCRKAQRSDDGFSSFPLFSGFGAATPLKPAELWD